MKYFKTFFIASFLLILPLMSDARAPDGQCYIVLPVDNEDAAIRELDINPNSLEVYESDDARTTYVTLGKTYIDLFNANKNIFPSNTRCSKGNNLGSFWLWLIEDPGALKNLYILGEDPIGLYGFDRIAIKRFTTKDIDFLFSSNVNELKKLIEPYSTFINQKGIEFRKAEETRIAKENAALEAKKIALAKAAEEEANKKAAAEAASLKAIADAEEAKQLQKEKRRTRWLWVGIIFLFFYAYGKFQRKIKATEAGFKSVKEYEQHLKDKQKEEDEKLLQKAIKIARNCYQESTRNTANKKILKLKPGLLSHEKVKKAFLLSFKQFENENAKKIKERKEKAAKKAGFNSVAEYEKYLRKKEAQDAGFTSVAEHRKYLDEQRRADAAEARAREAEARAREAEAKANRKSSDGSLLKTAAGVAVTAAAVKAVQRPPRVVFNDPSYKVGEIKRAGLLPVSGWRIKWYKVNYNGKKIKSGSITRKKPGVFKNKASISNPCKGYIYWE